MSAEKSKKNEKEVSKERKKRRSIRRSIKRNKKNKIAKSKIKNITKKIEVFISEKKDFNIIERYKNELHSLIDKAKKSGVIKNNKRNRQKSRIDKRINKLINLQKLQQKKDINLDKPSNNK